MITLEYSPSVVANRSKTTVEMSSPTDYTLYRLLTGKMLALKATSFEEFNLLINLSDKDYIRLTSPLRNL